MKLRTTAMNYFVAYLAQLIPSDPCPKLYTYWWTVQLAVVKRYARTRLCLTICVRLCMFSISLHWDGLSVHKFVHRQECVPGGEL